MKSNWVKTASQYALMLFSLASSAATVDEHHPWRPPFGLERVGTLQGRELDVDAQARPDRRINPVDLDTILVPHDWLLLAGGQSAVVNVAAVSKTRDLRGARLRVWFEGETAVESAFPLKRGQRAVKAVTLKAESLAERSSLHVSLTAEGRELWAKSIPTLIVARALGLPRFGAVETKLRYDGSISMKDPESGVLSTIPYKDGWDQKLKDIVVSLPNGARYVFWRGSSYVPFWATDDNKGFSYEWAETVPPPGAYADSLEPLADKELRYGRVRIVESTASRVHVRWTYQSASFKYEVFGDQTTEDYYFYPDGFGTRVVTLTSTPMTTPPDPGYELAEFLFLLPQAAFPLDVLPAPRVEALSLNGKKEIVSFPHVSKAKGPAESPSFERMSNPGQGPMLFRIFSDKSDPTSAICFNPRDASQPFVWSAFVDKGQVVTPGYWGDHWPLGRGKATGGSIDDRIYISPSHVSLMTWGLPLWGNRPEPLWTQQLRMPDTLGHVRDLSVRRWAWLIGRSDAADDVLLGWAESFSQPPSLELLGAHLDLPSYVPERRAMRIVVDSPQVSITLKPKVRSVNPVFELDGGAREIASVTRDGVGLKADAYAWDGNTLWVRTTIDAGGATLVVQFK